MNIIPQIGQRGVLVGRTGSGKTTTAIALLEAALWSYPVIVIDTKGVRAFQQLPGFIYSDPRQLLDSFATTPDGAQAPYTRIYRPEREDNDPRALDWFLDEIYELRESLYLYIDEVYQVVEGVKSSRGLANLLQRGRYREFYDRSEPVQVSVICATQRPSWVPKIIFTEAEHFYIHELSPGDTEIMADYTAEPRVEDEPATGHEFYYFNVQTHSLRLCEVNLEKEERIAS